MSNLIFSILLKSAEEHRQEEEQGFGNSGSSDFLGSTVPQRNEFLFLFRVVMIRPRSLLKTTSMY